VTILILERIVCAPEYTEGELLWFSGSSLADARDGSRICSVLEDPDRGLDAADPLTWPRKVYGDTCIPITSPVNPYLVNYAWSNRLQREMPFISGIPTHTGVMFHGGNRTSDTLGCPLLADRVVRGVIPDGSSKPAVFRFNAWLRRALYASGKKPIPLYVRHRRAAPSSQG
jgi:hypothetical protein